MLCWLATDVSGQGRTMQRGEVKGFLPTAAVLQRGLVSQASVS